MTSAPSPDDRARTIAAAAASAKGSGTSTAFDGGPIYADKVYHYVCQLTGEKVLNCSGQR